MSHDHANVAPGAPSQEERGWALVAHLAPLVISLVSGGILGWLVPLAIYVIKRDSSSFIADQSKEALNFRITWFLIYLVLTPVTVFLVISVVGICIAGPIWLLAWLVETILAIVAGVAAYGGERYRYPGTLRLLQ